MPAECEGCRGLPSLHQPCALLGRSPLAYIPPAGLVSSTEKFCSLRQRPQVLESALYTTLTQASMGVGMLLQTVSVSDGQHILRQVTTQLRLAVTIIQYRQALSSAWVNSKPTVDMKYAQALNRLSAKHSNPTLVTSHRSLCCSGSSDSAGICVLTTLSMKAGAAARPASVRK